MRDLKVIIGELGEALDKKQSTVNSLRALTLVAEMKEYIGNDPDFEVPIEVFEQMPQKLRSLSIVGLAVVVGMSLQR